MKKEMIVYSVSDSLGGTSQKLLSAVTAQYPDIIFNNSYRFPFINKEEELLDILRDAIKDDALVISTLVDGKLASVAREFSQAHGLSYLDLMHPFFEIIKEKTGTAGYSLLNNSYGFQLVTHQPFQNAQKVVEAPFAQTSLKKVIENVEQRTLIKSTSIGQILMAQQQELCALLHEFYDF